MLAFRPRQVIDKLILGEVTALRIRLRSDSPLDAVEVAIKCGTLIGRAVLSADFGREDGNRRRYARRPKDCRVVGARGDELIHNMRTEGMRFGELSAILGLMTESVERRVDGVGVTRLRAAIYQNPES